MHIICPHCTTSYAINLATLGVGGRTVRCSRCKEVWLAHREDAVEMADAVADAGGSAGDAADPDADQGHALSRLRRLVRRPAWLRAPALPRPSIPTAGLPATCVAMGALVVALLMW